MLNRIISFCLIGSSFFLLQCNEDEPENLPAEPVIAFKNIKFIETPLTADYDTLKLTISYQDFDSDLGFDYHDDKDFDYPYNDIFTFLEDGSGDTTKVYSSLVHSSHSPYISYFLLNTSGKTGKLVTDKTRLKANYSYLPQYDPNSCLNYSYTELLVSEESNAVDNSYNILDTLYDENSKAYYQIWEPLLYQLNENHYNILIEFFVSDDGINFSEYNWFEEFWISFNGRFPLLERYTGQINSGPFKIKAKTPWVGEITYSMVNPSFLAIFSTKTMKLKVTIKDRALHSSNVIETAPFTLQSIK